MRRTLTDLLDEQDFKKFWVDTCRGIDSFRVEEAVLDFVHRPKPRVGNAEELNTQAAIDMWRLEGALELWEKLTGLLYEKIKDQEIEDDSSIG